MRPVAERFVVGLSASTQGHSIPNFIGLAIGGNNRNASPHPDRSADLFGCVFDQSKRWFELRFDRLAGFSIPHHQPPRGTMAGLMLDESSRFRIIGLLDEVP